jgi:hypothetical protein
MSLALCGWMVAMADAEALQERRLFLLDSIAIAADEIKEIDMQLAILESIELEADLIQSEAKT